MLVASHQDAHFRCGLDDTGALVAEMTMAKAMMMSGARPKRTVVFLLTSGEEFGYGNSYFDYLTGAWWAISHAHPDWAGRAVAMLNLECFARPGAASANTSPELAQWLRADGEDQPRPAALGDGRDVRQEFVGRRLADARLRRAVLHHVGRG